MISIKCSYNHSQLESNAKKVGFPCSGCRLMDRSTRALERMGGTTRSLGLVPRVMQRELGRERSKAGKFENGGSN